jgi:hypothetical protein
LSNSVDKISDPEAGDGAGEALSCGKPRYLSTSSTELLKTVDNFFDLSRKGAKNGKSLHSIVQICGLMRPSDHTFRKSGTSSTGTTKFVDKFQKPGRTGEGGNGMGIANFIGL